MGEYQRALSYLQRVRGLVGDKDPVEILSSTIPLVQSLTVNLSKQQAESTANNKWSVSDVLQHLVDAELTNGYRLRMVLSSDNPLIVGFNQEYWVERFNTSRPLQDIYGEWNVLRKYNLRLIRSITVDERNRTYEHHQRGKETLQDLIVLMAGHDIIHREQLNGLISSVSTEPRP